METVKMQCEAWRITVSNVVKSEKLRLIVDQELDYLYDLNNGNWWVAIKPNGERLCEYRSVTNGTGYCAEVNNVNLTALTHKRMIEKICHEIGGEQWNIGITKIERSNGN